MILDCKIAVIPVSIELRPLQPNQLTIVALPLIRVPANARPATCREPDTCPWALLEPARETLVSSEGPLVESVIMISFPKTVLWLNLIRKHESTVNWSDFKGPN